jgi:hypothetical protein
MTILWASPKNFRHYAKNPRIVHAFLFDTADDTSRKSAHGQSDFFNSAKAPQNDTEPPEDLHQLSKETDWIPQRIWSWKTSGHIVAKG